MKNNEDADSKRLKIILLFINVELGNYYLQNYQNFLNFNRDSKYNYTSRVIFLLLF